MQYFGEIYSYVLISITQKCWRKSVCRRILPCINIVTRSEKYTLEDDPSFLWIHFISWFCHVTTNSVMSLHDLSFDIFILSKINWAYSFLSILFIWILIHPFSFLLQIYSLHFTVHFLATSFSNVSRLTFTYIHPLLDFQQC